MTITGWVIWGWFCTILCFGCVFWSIHVMFQLYTVVEIRCCVIYAHRNSLLGLMGIKVQRWIQRQKLNQYVIKCNRRLQLFQLFWKPESASACPNQLTPTQNNTCFNLWKPSNSPFVSLSRWPTMSIKTSYKYFLINFNCMEARHYGK